MTNKPVWLLDIDGVVNAHSLVLHRLHKAWPKDDWRHTRADSGTATWDITSASPVLDFICEVHESGLAEIRWHTTWQEQANNVSVVLGLPEFPIHEAPEFNISAWQRTRGVGTWWKLPAAWRVVVDEQRPLIWTDDDIDYEMTKEQRRSLTRAGKVLAISPDMYVGLCQVHLDRIRTFIGLEVKGDELDLTIGSK